MRAEDIVGICFFGLLITGLVVTISGSRTSFTPKQRAHRRGVGIGLIGFTLFAFGLVSFLLIHSSPRQVVEGNLWNVRQPMHGGAQFIITDRSSRTVQIRCTYNGPGLLAGERARVRYVEYNGKLIEMDMLSGPYQVWHLREPSGEDGYAWWMFVGIVCGFFAYRQLAQNKRDQITDR